MRTENNNDEKAVQTVTLKDKLDWLLSMGYFAQSALGDDYAGILLTRKGIPLDLIEYMYYKMKGYIVALHKSLTNPFSLEYLRDQSIPGYVRYVKMTREKDAGTIRRFVVQLKPTAHVSKSKIFPERLDSPSKAISCLSQMMKDRNLEWHPNLRQYIEEWAPYMIFNGLTAEHWYVPLANIDAWVKAGKPGEGSPYHVKITNITGLVDVASKDAEYLQSDLNSLVEISWTKSTIKDYDPIGTLPQSRYVRMVDAIRTNNEKMIKVIESEVVATDLDLILNYNLGIIDEDEELLDDEIAEFATANWRTVTRK